MGIAKRFITSPIILITGIWLLFTWQFWLKGLVPAPLDFLVSFYGPWQSQYPIPAKNPAISDVVNQIIPWKIFTINEWQAGRIPLWNPYNFSGTPHAANWQSAIFYPTNLLPLLFNFIDGWSLYVLTQPLLAGIFTYLFCRTLKLSPLSSTLSSLSFAYGGFMTSWLEWGTLGHAILWLPASLWAIEKYLSTLNAKYIILNTVSLSLSLLAGHLQISLYVMAISFTYWILRLHQEKKLTPRSFFLTLSLFSISCLLVSFQLFPSIKLYFNSVRSQSIDIGWFNYFRIPIEYLATFIAPDFFGNPTTRNEWGRGSYVEMMGYVGLTPLILALSGIKLKQARFFVWIIIISLFLSLRTPLANIITFFKIPIFATSSPARIISLISFSLSILAGIGLDHSLNNRFKFLKYPTLLTGFILVILWLIAFFLKNPVAQRNLIVPSAILAILAGTYFVVKKTKKFPVISYSLFLILISVSDLYRFHHKYTPYTSREYWYPKLPVIEKLQQIQGNDRSFGLFDANLNLPFGIYSVEGYDALFPKRYAELISTQKTGAISLPQRTSGAQIAKNEPYTIPLLNQLGVKYVIQPTVHGSAPWELHLWEYPNQFEMIYDDNQYQIFINKKAAQNPYHPETIIMTSQPRYFTIGLVTSAIAFAVLLIIVKKKAYAT